MDGYLLLIKHLCPHFVLDVTLFVDRILFDSHIVISLSFHHFIFHIWKSLDLPQRDWTACLILSEPDPRRGEEPQSPWPCDSGISLPERNCWRSEGTKLSHYQFRHWVKFQITQMRIPMLSLLISAIRSKIRGALFLGHTWRWDFSRSQGTAAKENAGSTWGFHKGNSFSHLFTFRA